jgi:hypothetical protein
MAFSQLRQSMMGGRLQHMFFPNHVLIVPLCPELQSNIFTLGGCSLSRTAWCTVVVDVLASVQFKLRRFMTR